MGRAEGTQHAAAALVVAFLIFGVPRLNRRSRVAGVLFGEDDDRGSADMRRDAAAAASRGDYATAIAELFRALARGLAERTIVTVTPGTTARGFAGRADRFVAARADDGLYELVLFHLRRAPDAERRRR